MLEVTERGDCGDRLTLEPLEFGELQQDAWMKARRSHVVAQLHEGAHGLGTHAEVPQQPRARHPESTVRWSPLQCSLDGRERIVVALARGQGTRELEGSLFGVRAPGEFLTDRAFARCLDRFVLLRDQGLLYRRIEQARRDQRRWVGARCLGCTGSHAHGQQQRRHTGSHGLVVAGAPGHAPCFPSAGREPPCMSAPPLGVSRLRRLRTQLEVIVAEAAEIVHRRRARTRRGEVRRKGPGDFVTAVDLAAERWLRDRLCALVPEAGFLGEETPSTDLDRGLVWCVDPIDGTSNFAHGLPMYAVAVALLERRRPVVAAVWTAPDGLLHSAARGLGASRRGRRIRIPDGRADDGAIHGAQWFRGNDDLRFLSALQARGARIRTFGSTVVQLVDVACGRLDANVQQQGRIWDLAAAGLIVEEAGGRFTDWHGRPVFPFPSLTVEHTATLAAAPNVHRPLLASLSALAPKPQKTFRKSNARS